MYMKVHCISNMYTHLKLYITLKLMSQDFIAHKWPKGTTI